MAAPLISYQLWIVLRQPRTITIGRLGEFDFPAGVYVYTGSAKRNLEARIARHCRRDKSLRWHIDYLLVAEGVELFRIRRSARRECVLNRSVGGQVLVPGFGASDCRKGCGSHLRFLGTQGADGEGAASQDSAAGLRAVRVTKDFTVPPGAGKSRKSD